MPTTRFPLGTRVIARLNEDRGELPGMVIGGPLFKDGTVILKVQHENYEHWYPLDRLRAELSLPNDDTYH
jgi:hypothetical protein